MGSEPSSTDECKCGHARDRHVSGCESCHAQGLDILAHHSFIEPEKPEPECQHPDKRYAGALYDGPNDRKSFLYYACPDCMTTWKEEVAEEPPLTPEEEEELPPEPSCCGNPNCLCEGSCDCDQAREDTPPQPLRRPPYAVAYSVQGHLYEVALPGDATVKAVDGALVIQHHLGPVAAICQVLPIVNKES